MLSFSQAFSRPYMANMQSTQRSGDAEGMTHAALTKSVTTHGDGGEHGEHGGGHDEGHNDFSNAAKASLALSSQRQKESNKQTEEKDGKKDDELARVEKDPLLNRLMSQVSFDKKDESTIEFLQGSTLNTMGHFSEGFTLGAVLAGLFHAQKIINSENNNGQLIPGQIIAGRGKDGHFYKIAYTNNGQTSFWDRTKKNPNGESLQILRSKHKGFLGYFRGYEAVADIKDPATTRYNAEKLNVLFNMNGNPLRYIADSVTNEIQTIERLDNDVPLPRLFQREVDVVTNTDVYREIANKSPATKLKEHWTTKLGNFLSPLKTAFSATEFHDIPSRTGVPQAVVNTSSTTPITTGAKNPMGKVLFSLQELIPFDPHEVMSMKKKDKLSKFLKYLPPVKNLINWGIWGGVAAVAFGTITEGYHAGMRLPSITLGGGGGSPPASPPPEGHSPSTSKENPSPKESAPSASNPSNPYTLA
jgi:hypothetical protein